MSGGQRLAPAAASSTPISNRGVMDLLGAFNRGNFSDGGIGDGLRMRDGYTIVFVGWEFDVPGPAASNRRAGCDPARWFERRAARCRNHGERTRGGGIPLPTPGLVHSVRAHQNGTAREGDPRVSIEERYHGVDDYLQRIRSAAMDLIRPRYLLAEDQSDLSAVTGSTWAARYAGLKTAITRTTASASSAPVHDDGSSGST